MLKTLLDFRNRLHHLDHCVIHSGNCRPADVREGAHILGHEEDRWKCSPIRQPTHISSVILILCTATKGISVLLRVLWMVAYCCMTHPPQVSLHDSRISRSKIGQSGQEYQPSHGHRLCWGSMV